MSEQGDDAAQRSLPENSQHVPIRLGNLNEFDPAGHALANDQLEEMDRWMLERTADLVKRCREWYGGVRIPSHLPCDSRLLRGGSQRVLLRRAEGSPLYQSAAEQVAAFCADGGLEDHQRVDAD